MKQILSGIGLALALALTLAVPALAGGWAVITLDELPGPVTAGEPLEIGFMVRQHGVTPLAGLTPVITARLEGAIKSVKVIAEEKGDVGHYVATLTLPQEGTWEWSIEAFGEPQSMPALTVVAAAVVPQAEESAPEPAFNTTSLLAGIGGLAGVVIGLFVLRSRRRWAIVLVLAGLLVSGYRVVSAANQPKVEEETKPLDGRRS